MEAVRPNCLFCKIASQELSATIRYEDSELLAFDDIHPKAPIHILIIPKKHIPTIDDLEDSDRDLVGHMVGVARDLAREHTIHESGYRLVFNVKSHGGQMVDHIHLHLIGGKHLGSMA